MTQLSHVWHHMVSSRSYCKRSLRWAWNMTFWWLLCLLHAPHAIDSPFLPFFLPICICLMLNVWGGERQSSTCVVSQANIPTWLSSSYLVYGHTMLYLCSSKLVSRKTIKSKFCASASYEGRNKKNKYTVLNTQPNYYARTLFGYLSMLLVG